MADHEQATDAVCQKADWLAETAELPAVTDLTGVRLRRWGREYGGYVAAGALAMAVLTCAMTGLPGAAMTWHPGNPVAESSPSVGPSRSAAAQPSPAVSGPSPSPRRRPAKRPAAASKPRPAAASPRPTASPARSASPSPSPVMLGPADGRGLAAIVDAYCDRRFDRYAVLRNPWAGAEDNWACRRWRHSSLIEVDMTEVCVLRYGAGAVARYLDAEDPFSWRCYRG